MPRTIQHEMPVLGIVVFETGDALTRRAQTSDEAWKWCCAKMHQYGTAIVATDVVENVVELNTN